MHLFLLCVRNVLYILVMYCALGYVIIIVGLALCYGLHRLRSGGYYLAMVNSNFSSYKR